MEKHIWWFIISLLAICLTGCYFDFDDEDGGPFSCIEGEGSLITRELYLDDFRGVKLKVDAEVHLYYGEQQYVEVRGQQNIINELELDIHSGVWDIEFDDCVRNYETLEIFITIPKVTFINVSGSGDVIGEEAFNSDQLELIVSGSGRLEGIFFVNELEGNISGSGNIRLAGESNRMDVRISGSGDLHAFDFVSDYADLRVSGSGDARVHVLSEMDVKISGSGDVFYKGYPVIHSSISGSGELIDSN